MNAPGPRVVRLTSSAEDLIRNANSHNHNLGPSLAVGAIVSQLFGTATGLSFVSLPNKGGFHWYSIDILDVSDVLNEYALGGDSCIQMPGSADELARRLLSERDIKNSGAAPQRKYPHCCKMGLRQAMASL